jgi:outer membrane lipopolysaccharide assembly protein LptE/RlpB
MKDILIKRTRVPSSCDEVEICRYQCRSNYSEFWKKVQSNLWEARFKQVNVRIVAASNKDLISLVREGRFREYLFYRIVQAQIYLSPLEIGDQTSYFLLDVF